MARIDKIPRMKIIVAGLGKSGTTALFFKLQQSLPNDTYCLFEPTCFQDTNDAAHVLAKVLINQKINIASFSSFDKKIFIIRDARDNLVSRVLYDVYNAPELCCDLAKSAAIVNLLRRKEANPQSMPLLDVINIIDALASRNLLRRAIEVANIAINFRDINPDYFHYRYEDLIYADFKSIESYLGICLSAGPASVPAELSRVARTKGRGDWKNWLTPTDVKFFQPYFASYLKLNGYSDDWTLADEPRIPAKHGSEYVMKLAEERRRVMQAATI
jgi:hypothetical protein